MTDPLRDVRDEVLAKRQARRDVDAAAESCAALLGEIAALLRRFVVMTPAQARVVALWVVHTYLVAAARRPRTWR